MSGWGGGINTTWSKKHFFGTTGDWRGESLQRESPRKHSRLIHLKKTPKNTAQDGSGIGEGGTREIKRLYTRTRREYFQIEQVVDDG